MNIARSEAARLAKHTLDLDGQLKSNEQKLDKLVKVSETAPFAQGKVIPGGSGGEMPRGMVTRRTGP